MISQLVYLASVVIFVAAHHDHDHSHQPTLKQENSLQAVVSLTSPGGHDVHGNVTFIQEEGKVHILAHIHGMPPGHYGFHVHETGDITGGCLSTGAHFNPEKKQHGHPDDENRHVGDLGNIVFDNDSYSHVDFYDSVIALNGPHNIIGRAVVLHAMADDFGRTDHPDSKTTGNAGGRIACGVIGILRPVYGWESNAASTKYWTTTVAFVSLSAITLILQ